MFMAAMATALIIMEGIGESLMDGAILIMDGAILIMDGVLLIMGMDTVMVMDTVMDTGMALDMAMLIIEEEEAVVMLEEQHIEVTIDILAEELDTRTAEDLILLAETAPILEVNLAEDPVIIEETQLLDDQDLHLTVEITPAEDHLIALLDQVLVLAQDLILTEALAEALEAVAEATVEVVEVVVLAAEAAEAEDAAEVKT